jgi:hypothetical protein
LGAERVLNPLVEDVANLVRGETQGKGVEQRSRRAARPLLLERSPAISGLGAG